jgi:Calpain family cysteine protease
VQDQRCVLFKDGANALDVVQGQLKDCYFLSAISVLGEKNIQAMIKTTEDEWRQLGSFCVRFYRDG